MKKRFNVLILIEAVLLAALLVLQVGRNGLPLAVFSDKKGQDGGWQGTVAGALETADAQTEGGNGVEETKKVALTFDDGPNECYTEELLDGLAIRNVKATFFLIGKKVKENPGIVERMYQEGHLIGNHSYDHVNLSEMSKEAACEQINQTNEAIKEVTGVVPEYLRPPFGSFKKNLDAEMNMIEVLWDVDPRDWSVKNTGKVVNRVVTKVEDNDIILLHDEYATSVAAAMEIIDILKSQGYEFVTIDELILE